MWAEKSDKATNARLNAAPDTHVQNAILDIDAANILKKMTNKSYWRKKGAAEFLRQRLAERQGFEPWKPKGFNGFRDRPDRPLRHLSSRLPTACFAVASAKLHNFAD